MDKLYFEIYNGIIISVTNYFPNTSNQVIERNAEEVQEPYSLVGKPVNAIELPVPERPVAIIDTNIVPSKKWFDRLNIANLELQLATELDLPEVVVSATANFNAIKGRFTEAYKVGDQLITAVDTNEPDPVEPEIGYHYQVLPESYPILVNKDITLRVTKDGTDITSECIYRANGPNGEWEEIVGHVFTLYLPGNWTIKIEHRDVNNQLNWDIQFVLSVGENP